MHIIAILSQVPALFYTCRLWLCPNETKISQHLIYADLKPSSLNAKTPAFEDFSQVVEKFNAKQRNFPMEGKKRDYVALKKKKNRPRFRQT